jgi:hypothetical protein
MREEDRGAFIMSQVACMQARLSSMVAQNIADATAGRPLSYLPQDFDALTDQFGLGHNAVVTFLQGL